MWYNALTPLGVIAIFTTLPAYISPHINEFFMGNKCGRLYYNNIIEHIGYIRDYEYGGKQNWKFNGLEVIPDK